MASQTTRHTPARPIGSGLALIILLLLPLVARARELISLNDGATYVGNVTAVTDTHITVDVEFPTRETRRIARDELTDRTLWRVLSGRTDLGDSRAWLLLGHWAEGRGLLVPALVSYRRSARGTEAADEAAKAAAGVEAKLAQELFDRGERYLVEERPASAMRYFEIILRRYPSAPVAPIAKTRLNQIRRALAEAKAAAKSATERTAEDKALRKVRAQWDAEVEAIRKYMRDAARVRPAHLDPSQPVRTSRGLERVVRRLEAAWRRVRDLGAPPAGIPEDSGAELAQEVKARLVRAYLDTGLAYLIRPSLNQAEEFCTKACDLDPDNAATHALHEKIIYARLNSGWWRGGYLGRRGR